jgi:hypothetical protein
MQSKNGTPEPIYRILCRPISTEFFLASKSGKSVGTTITSNPTQPNPQKKPPIAANPLPCSAIASGSDLAPVDSAALELGSGPLPGKPSSPAARRFPAFARPIDSARFSDQGSGRGGASALAICLLVATCL